MTGGEKDKQHKRRKTGGEKFTAAAKKLGSWSLDEEGRARFPYQKAPKKQAVYVFIVDNRRDRPCYVGSTHNIWERMRTYSNAKFGGSLHEDKINTAVKSKLDGGVRVNVYYLTPDPSLVPWGETGLKLSVIHGLEQGILQMRAKPEWNKMHGSMRVKESRP
jgi:hypothetical protein